MPCVIQEVFLRIPVYIFRSIPVTATPIPDTRGWAGTAAAAAAAAAVLSAVKSLRTAVSPSLVVVPILYWCHVPGTTISGI